MYTEITEVKAETTVQGRFVMQRDDTENDGTYPVTADAMLQKQVRSESAVRVADSILPRVYPAENVSEEWSISLTPLAGSANNKDNLQTMSTPSPM